MIQGEEIGGKELNREGKQIDTSKEELGTKEAKMFMGKRQEIKNKPTIDQDIPLPTNFK